MHCRSLPWYCPLFPSLKTSREVSPLRALGCRLWEFLVMRGRDALILLKTADTSSWAGTGEIGPMVGEPDHLALEEFALVFGDMSASGRPLAAGGETQTVDATKYGYRRKCHFDDPSFADTVD